MSWLVYANKVVGLSQSPARKSLFLVSLFIHIHEGAASGCEATYSWENYRFCEQGFAKNIPSIPGLHAYYTAGFTPWMFCILLK